MFTDQPFNDKPRWIELRIGSSDTRLQKQHWGTFAMFKDLDGNQFMLLSR